MSLVRRQLDSPAPLLLLAGSDRRALIAAAIHRLPLFAQPLVASVDRADLAPDGPARDVALALRASGRSVRALAPPRTTAGSWFTVRGADWAAVDVGADRLDRVWLPASLVAALAIVAVNTVSPQDSARSPIAIGIWASFAHPRQRNGARLSDERGGLTAEIALAVRPALVLLFAAWGGAELLIATPDQVAAEVAGIAFRQLMRPLEGEPVGPWEYPLVQRATELQLGVSIPDQIAPEVRWIGDVSDPRAASFSQLAAELFARIGVAIRG